MRRAIGTAPWTTITDTAMCSAISRSSCVLDRKQHGLDMPSCEMRRRCVTVRAPRACAVCRLSCQWVSSLSAPSCRGPVFGMSPDKSDREDTEQTKVSSQQRVPPSADLTSGGLLASSTLGSACIMRRPRLPPVSSLLRHACLPRYGMGRRELLGAVGIRCVASVLGRAVFRGE